MRDLACDRIAIIEGDGRASPAGRVAMIPERLDEMADKAGPRPRRTLACRLCAGIAGSVGVGMLAPPPRRMA